MKTKTCNKCYETKELSEFYKSKNYKKDGHKSSCKECNKKQYAIYKKTYYYKNREKILIKETEYYKKNRQKMLKKEVERYNNNRASILKKADNHRIKNREKINKLSKAKFREETKSLSDRYIKHALRLTGILTKDITPELMELKRIQLQFKREINYEKSKSLAV